MDNLLKRFLTAFNEIEGYLNNFNKVKAHTKFYELIARASVHHAAVRQYAFDLREFGDLRNAIMHGYNDAKPLAKPYVSSVIELEGIRDQLLKPLKLGTTKVKTDVFTCRKTDHIGPIVKTMFKDDFSQVPVYENSLFVQLLNTDTISRWMSSSFEQGLPIHEKALVSDVLQYSAPGNKHRILGESKTVFDALESFRKGFEMGCGLDAIILTPKGTHKETPTGIATVFDIPMLESLTVIRKS